MASEFYGIVKYLRRNQRTFAEEPFNAVDSLIFSTLSYLEFENSPIMTQGSFERVKLHDVLALTDWNVLKRTGWISVDPSTPLFMLYIMASRRMRDVEVTYLKADTRKETECQFGAVTFVLPVGDTLLHVACSGKTVTASDYRRENARNDAPIPELAYVSYRGTDNTFIGWHEDFNLSFMDVIPAQTEALQYLKEVARNFNGPLLTGGHSKGGNLSEYVAAAAPQEVFSRLVTAFNHDGPAFLDKPSERYTQEAFYQKHFKMVPESSLIGMLLETSEDFHVVQSDAMGGVFQHVPYSWQVAQDDFIYLEKLNTSASIIDESMRAWFKTHSAEDRERVVSTVFDIVDKTGAKTLGEMTADKRKKISTIASELTKLDPETRGIITSIMGSLASCLMDETTSAIAQEVAQAAPVQKSVELFNTHFKRLPEAKPTDAGTS